MTKHLNTKTRRADNAPSSPQNPIEEWSISIACISFFPLLYLVGKSIGSWIN